MVRKEIGTELVSKSGDWEGFLAEFQDESDRATAILGGVFLDEHLRQLIANALAGEKGVVDELLNGPLQNFASRIKLAYCLRLISSSEYADIQLIRDIRNSFAHRLHGLSFENAGIKKQCKQFKTTSNVLAILNPNPKGIPPRFRYIATVYMLSQRIAVQRMSAEATKKEHIARQVGKEK